MNKINIQYLHDELINERLRARHVRNIAGSLLFRLGINEWDNSLTILIGSPNDKNNKETCEKWVNKYLPEKSFTDEEILIQIDQLEKDIKREITNKLSESANDSYFD